MSIYFEMLLLTLVVVWIVDLSGWTQTWLGWLSRFTARHGYGPVKELRPFSCSQCSAWWCCLLWALLQGELSLATVAAAAGCAFLSRTLCEMLIFIREALTGLVITLERWTQRH